MKIWTYLFALFILCPIMLCAAVNDSIRCYIAIDDNYGQKLQVGRELKVTYYVTRPFQQMTEPTWDDRVEVTDGMGREVTTSSTEIINGVRTTQQLYGRYYVVRLRREGEWILPQVKAMVNGEWYESEEKKIHVEPSKDIVKLECTFSIITSSVEAGKEFEAQLICNQRPDSDVPELDAPKLEQVGTVRSVSVRNDVSSYEFTYRLKAAQAGTYTLSFPKLSFGGVRYELSATNVDVK